MWNLNTANKQTAELGEKVPNEQKISFYTTRKDVVTEFTL